MHKSFRFRPAVPQCTKCGWRWRRIEKVRRNHANNNSRTSECVLFLSAALFCVIGAVLLLPFNGAICPLTVRLLGCGGTALLRAMVEEIRKPIGNYQLFT